MSSQGQPPKDQAANYALHYVRQIRQNVLSLMEMVTEDNEDHKELEKVFRKLEDNYNRSEQAAQAMPERMTVNDSLQKLALEYQEDFLPEEMSRAHNSKELFGKEKLESYIDSVNYLDTFQNYAHFNEQLIRLGSSTSTRRRPMILDPRPLVFSTYTPHSNPHTMFLQAVQNIKQDALQKRHGIWLNILEQSAFGSLLEMKTGNVVDKQTIISQKTLIVENNGTIEMLIFIAPHEEWRYLDQFGEFGGRKLDLMQRSQYLVYQKLTSIANQSLGILFAPSGADRDGPAQLLVKNFHWLTRYQKIFETKCRICHKYMKDYLPCVMFDPRNPAMSMHESCR